LRLHTLIFRSMLHYRGLNAALIAGIALATAVLTGSLLVGDSVRASLRDLATARLGPIDSVLVTPGFFDASFADRLNRDHDFAAMYGTAHAGLSLKGRAVDLTAKHSANGTQFFALDLPATAVHSGKVVINAPLATALDVAAGARVNLTMPLPSDIPTDAALSRRSRADVLASTSAIIDRIETQPNILALFSLAPSQRSPRNAWLNLHDLQSAIDRPGAANLLVFTHDSLSSMPEPAKNRYLQYVNQTISAVPALDALKSHLNLSDYGLSLAAVRDSNQLQLSSRSAFLRSNVEAAIKVAAPNAQLFSTYLLNKVELQSAATVRSSLHYVIATGTNAEVGGGVLNLGEVAINQWTAGQLHAAVGDTITFSFFKRLENGTLVDTPAPHAFKIVRILPMTGIGADPALTPDYPGFTDADTMADWSPPEGFPFDRKLVTPADEDYWNAHRAAPKFFLSLDDARFLWGTPLGALTSARLMVTTEKPALKDWQSAILTHLNPADFGFVFQPIRQQQLAAASGSTDFSGLFIGFSFFLILSALILLSLLFRLSIEQRTRQLGLLAALGFSPQRIRRIVLLEGITLSVIGTALGTVGGIAYTALMLKLLTTLWLPAVGTTNLHLAASADSLSIGAALSLLFAVATLYLSCRQLVKFRPLVLLGGNLSERGSSGSRKSSRVAVRYAIPWLLALAAMALLLSAALHVMSSELTCLSAGALLLLAVLVAIRVYLRNPLKLDTCTLQLHQLAARSARLRPTRSLLVIALLAFASFILILVASMKQQSVIDPALIPSGTGGYRLILTADIPLLGDLNTPAGRKILGLRDAESPLLTCAHFTNLCAYQGQDISCLNMTKPTQPTILGVPHAILQKFGRGSTMFDGVTEVSYRQSPNEAFVSVNADSLKYILHANLGDSFAMVDQRGETITMKYFRTLNDCVLQSELMIEEKRFTTFFPLQTGTSVVLIECPAQDAEPLARLLESELDEFSVTVESTTARLARYKEVANTYLATFQTLGGFGLLLGTLGLAVVLLRSTLERRSELALLLAVGFSRQKIAMLILMENTALLAAGLLLGTITALIAVAPAARSINWPSLLASFAAIFLTGWISIWLSLRWALRGITPAALRND